MKPIAKARRNTVPLKTKRAHPPRRTPARRTSRAFRLKKILVPLDLSECSKKALQYALPLARQHGAAITLLYVVPSPTYSVGEYGGIEYAPLETEMQATAKKELADLVRSGLLRSKVAGGSLIRAGSPAAEIIRTAKAAKTDLIVIATHGRTGLKHALMGSVAERVVQAAPCPVLVVREREREFVR